MRLRLAGVDAVNAVEVDLGERTVTVWHDGDSQVVEKALRSIDLDCRRIAVEPSPRLPSNADPETERRALMFALRVNAGLFVAELLAGLFAVSVGLVADSLDMAADAGVYALSLVAVGSAASRKRQLAVRSGYLQLVLASVGLAEVVRRLVGGVDRPDVSTMVLVSAVALLGNLAVLIVLRKVRSDEAHIQASWIFTANDIRVNIVVIISAFAVAVFDSPIPDLLAGAAIFLIVANGARRILGLAR